MASGSLTLNVSDEEFASRKADAVLPLIYHERGYEKLFVEHILQADKGLDFDFLVGGSGSAAPQRRPF
ncbi:L-arabonate dehydratase [compost metagenome]